MELQSNEINELAKALSLAQIELEGTEKDGKNPHYKSEFSTLHSCIAVTREPLSKNGLSIVQQLLTIEGKQHLVTTLLHESGQWIRSYGQLWIEKPTNQGYGSSITYLRRYSLCAMLGLFQEDDDAESADKLLKKNKKLPSASDEEYQNFVLDQNEIYGQDIVSEYLKKKSEKYKKSEKQVVFELLKDIEIFEKEIISFIKWKKQNDEVSKESL